MANITINVNTGCKILYSSGLLMPEGGNNSNYFVKKLIQASTISVGDIIFIEARIHRISGTGGTIFLDFSLESEESGFTTLVTLNTLTTAQNTGTSKHIIGVKTETTIGGLLSTSADPYFNITTSYTTYNIPNINNPLYIKFRLRNNSTSDISQISHLVVGLYKYLQ